MNMSEQFTPTNKNKILLNKPNLDGMCLILHGKTVCVTIFRLCFKLFMSTYSKAIIKLKDLVNLKRHLRQISQSKKLYLLVR